MTTNQPNTPAYASLELAFDQRLFRRIETWRAKQSASLSPEEAVLDLIEAALNLAEADRKFRLTFQRKMNKALAYAVEKGKDSLWVIEELIDWLHANKLAHVCCGQTHPEEVQSEAEHLRRAKEAGVSADDDDDEEDGADDCLAGIVG